MACDAVARQGVALVPEGHRLFASMSVAENLEMGMARARPGSWTLEAILDLFPAIGDLRNRRASDISGGQQQMVAIARALLRNPRLLLCDELSLGLAPKIINDIYACFERIRQSGISIILVEQDVVRARKSSDRIYCLLKGRVTLQGPSDDLSLDAIKRAYFGDTLP